MDRLFRRPIASWLALLFVLLVLVEAGNLLLVGDVGLRANASNALQTLAVALAAATFIAATRRVRREKSDAVAGWALFSVGALCFVAGAIAFFVVELSSPVTRSLNVSDLCFFVGYATLMVGLLRLAHEPLSRGEWRNALLDLALLSLISGVAVWEVSLRDLVSTLRATGNADSLIALVYALLNFALLLALYFQLVVNLGRGRMFVPHLLLVCAGLCLAISDLASGVVAVATGAFTSGSLIDLGWLLSAAFAGFASLYVLDRGAAEEVDHSQRLRATWSTMLSYTCLAGGAAVLLWGIGHRDALDFPLIATAVAGSLTLVGIRQVRTVHHALRLGDRLEVARAGLETSVRERTSELEATTASLRDSEVRLRHAQRVAAVGSWEIDLASGAVRWSDELFRLQRRAIDAGAPAFEELPRNYTTESWERLSAAVGHLSATGEPFELDLAVIRDDGTPWWQAARGEAVRAATGEIVGLRGAVVDITERKIAESVLRESEARYKSMFESAPIAVNITRGTDIIYANPGYLRSYGLTDMDDLRRREPLALFAPPSRAMVRENIERRAAGLPVPDSYEAMAQRTDGSTFPIIMYLARTTFADGPATVCFMVDISERVRAESALQRSQALLQSVTEGTPDAVFVKDTAGRYLMVNTAASAFLGGTRDEILDRDDAAFFPPDQARWLMDADRAVMASGVTRTFEEVLTTGGVERTYLATKGPVRDADGTIVGLFGVSRDISERKRSEAAVRESEARYKTLFEQAGDHILLLEMVPDGPPIMRDANAAALRALGYTRDELVGQPITLIDPSLPSDQSAQVAREVRANRQAEFETRHRRKDGSLFDVEVRTTPIMIEGALHAMSTERDITERKRAAAENARLAAELQQAQKMESVGRLAGGVAHDFNNMLGVIMGHAELALDQVDPSQPLHDDLSEIHKAARRSGDLTRHLLAFARKQTIMPRVIDVNEIVGGMLKMLGRLIGEDITLEWHPGTALWSIKMDPSQIDQIIANLCVNARDAITGVGRILIETSNITLDEDGCAGHPGVVPGEYVRLSVRDTGCGMDEQTLGQIFEPFFTTKGIGEGTGLGLATVYGSVRQNDGYVEAASRPGDGATFTLYLPRYVGSTGPSETATAPHPAMRGHETILLVEDEPAVLRLATTMLERQGYTVLACSSPREALRLAREHAGDIHVLLTDLVMPEMNGRDLSDAVRALRPRISRLFMSGYTANVIARDEHVELGVEFIAKPFGARELAAKVRETLDRTVAEAAP